MISSEIVDKYIAAGKANLVSDVAVFRTIWKQRKRSYICEYIHQKSLVLFKVLFRILKIMQGN